MVDYITYKGNKYPVRIAWSTIKHFDKTKTDTELIETSLWRGLIAGHKAMDIELTLKEEDIEFILDDCLDEFKPILEKEVSKIIASKKDEEDKKK